MTESCGARDLEFMPRRPGDMTKRVWSRTVMEMWSKPMSGVGQTGGHSAMRYYRVWTESKHPSFDEGLLIMARSMGSACEKVRAMGHIVMYIVEDL